jgi:hypothetical protein
MEIPLVPQAVLGGRRLRLAGAGDVLDVVAADRDEAADPFRPLRRNDAGGTPAPIVAGKDRALEGERVDQIEEVAAEGRLLARAPGLRIEKSCRAVAAQIRRDHPIARGGERRRHVVIGMNIVRKAVQQYDRTAAGRTALLVGDLEKRRANGFRPRIVIVVAVCHRGSTPGPSVVMRLIK